MKNLVSVIIPTFGRPNTLNRAINSVLNQTYANLEIIVVDDNNPDTLERNLTESVILQIQDSRLKYIKHYKNSNGAVARNTGIDNSQGEFIAFLDDDDEFESEKIEEQINYLRKNPHVSGVYCKAIHFKDGKPYYKTLYNKEGNLQYDILIMAHEIYTPSLIMYKAILNKINGFNEIFTRHQDYDLLLRYTEHYKIGCVDKYLLKIHNDDIMNQPDFISYEKNKIEFLNTFSDYINSYGSNSKLINRVHYFDLSFYALKRFHFKFFFKYFFKSKPSYSLLKLASFKFVKIFSRLSK